jgi:VanZ family protein
MLLLFVLSGQSDLPGVEQVSDKSVHTAVYLIFGILCLRATHGGLSALRAGPALAAVALALAYAALDEWHQSWVPGRIPSVLDWVADAIGVGLACLAVGLWSRFSTARHDSDRPDSASTRARSREPDRPGRD